MPASKEDFEFMAHALVLARRGLYTTDPNPNVGCVIVSPGGEIVGKGWHQRAGEGHAEVRALAEAGERAVGACVYVTLEPCAHQGRTPACAAALIDARVARVVFAVHDPNPQVAGRGARLLADAGIKVVEGVLESAATELNQGFIWRMQHGLPWVRCKIASSADGRTSLASGESQWITGPASRADVHRWRARSSAILTGVGTVLADDPSLTARLNGGEAVQQPLRVVVDSALQTPAGAKLFSSDTPVQIYHRPGAVGNGAALRQAGARLSEVTSAGARPELAAVLRDLALQEINDVLVEAGPVLNGALLEQGLINEIIIYQAGNLLGADSNGMFAISPLKSMRERQELELTDLRMTGPDIRMTYRLLATEK